MHTLRPTHISNYFIGNNGKICTRQKETSRGKRDREKSKRRRKRKRGKWQMSKTKAIHTLSHYRVTRTHAVSKCLENVLINVYGRYIVFVYLALFLSLSFSFSSFDFVSMILNWGLTMHIIDWSHIAWLI